MTTLVVTSMFAVLAASAFAGAITGAAEATIIDGTAAKPTLVVGRSFALEGDGYAVFRVTLSKAAIAWRR